MGWIGEGMVWIWFGVEQRCSSKIFEKSSAPFSSSYEGFLPTMKKQPPQGMTSNQKRTECPPP